MSIPTRSIFDLDLSNQRDTMYIFALRYTEPKYRFCYKACDNNWVRDEHRQWVKTNSNIDCFAFVMMVLKDLSNAGFIDFPQYYISNVIDIVRLALNQKVFISIQNCKIIIDNQYSGIFFYTTNINGLVTRGNRHMGFYFTFGDSVHIIHNTCPTGTQGGVKLDILNQQQFDCMIGKQYQFYIST
jgi:hypothetical protein